MKRKALGLTVMAAVLASIGFHWSMQSTSITISEVMEEAHKKPSELLKKVATGVASQQEKDRLLVLYQALAAQSPPRGDAKSWKTKTALLTRAAESAVAGKADADKELARAANCKACHEAHR